MQTENIKTEDTAKIPQSLWGNKIVFAKGWYCEHGQLTSLTTRNEHGYVEDIRFTCEKCEAEEKERKMKEYQARERYLAWCDLVE